MTDRELVRMMLRGDKNAFRELIIKYQDFVLNTCFKVLRNREDAEDIAQEVFIEAYKSISMLRQEENLSFWLHRIALNKSINHYKNHHNVIFRTILNIESFFKINHSDGSDNTPVSNDNPHEDLETRERREILEKALDSLPSNQKKAFILHHYECLSYKDIGTVLKISVPSVESLIFRAKANLKKQCNHYNSHSATKQNNYNHES
jgi:RNA polymerase sigma-70 factor (ECF subfamily)